MRYIVRSEVVVDAPSPLEAACMAWEQHGIAPLAYDVAEYLSDEPPVYGPFETVHLIETVRLERPLLQ